MEKTLKKTLEYALSKAHSACALAVADELGRDRKHFVSGAIEDVIYTLSECVCYMENVEDVEVNRRDEAHKTRRIFSDKGVTILQKLLEGGVAKVVFSTNSEHCTLLAGNGLTVATIDRRLLMEKGAFDSGLISGIESIENIIAWSGELRWK